MAKEKNPKTISINALEIQAQEPPRSEADKAAIARFVAKRRNSATTPRLQLTRDSNGTATIALDDKDALLSAVSGMEAFGTTSEDFQSYSMGELLDASCRGGHDNPYPEHQMNGVLAAMHGINPHDEIEGMLASQMVATHFMAMRRLRSVKNSETITQQDSHGNLAIKLMRTFTAQMEALNRYRGKGQQRIIVQHVNVENGGQAIVGNVTHPEGGGVQKKTEEQPHAITHASEQAMPSPNKKRKTVSVSRDA